MKEKNVIPAAVRIVSRKCKNESSIDKHLLKFIKIIMPILS